MSVERVFEQVSALLRRFDREVRDFDRQASRMGRGEHCVHKTDNEIRIVVEAAGFAPNDIYVELEGNLLSIYASKAHPDTGYIELNKEFRLSRGVSPENIKASVKNGLLVIKVRRPDDAQPSKRIPVT